MNLTGSTNFFRLKEEYFYFISSRLKYKLRICSILWWGTQTLILMNLLKSNLIHDCDDSIKQIRKKKRKKPQVFSHMDGVNTYDVLTGLQTFAQLSYGACTNLSASLHQSAQSCCHFSWSRQKQRRQRVGERENVAIISPVKLVKKTPVEVKQFSWHICSIFPPESGSRFGAPLPNAAKRSRTETQELPGHQTVRTLLELHGWKRMTWISSEMALLCWTDLSIWCLYFFGPLWTSLRFSCYLDVATDGKELLFILVNPPETLEKTWFLPYFCFVGSRGGWDEKKKHSHREEKMLFPKPFRWQMLYYLCRAIQSQL